MNWKSKKRIRAIFQKNSLLQKIYKKMSILKMNHYSSMSDEEYLKKMFLENVGYKLNLQSPTTYNEKLQWLKLYDRNPLYTQLVDKCEVKEYVKDVIGAEYVVPLYGVWESFDEINFDLLPSKFVLKCTHDCGGLVICKDKSKLNMAEAKSKIDKALNENYYYRTREWPYKNVKPRIIAEQLVEISDSDDLPDYKFFCFDGIVKAMFIATERNIPGEEVKFDFYDREFNHLSIIQGHENNKNNPPQKPLMFEKMVDLAEQLSKGIPHVRVDFYEANGKIYFGEMTFFHFGGMVPFDPMGIDSQWGSYINLPKSN